MALPSLRLREHDVEAQLRITRSKIVHCRSLFGEAVRSSKVLMVNSQPCETAVVVYDCGGV